MTCPKCGSTNVQMQTFQEQRQGSRTKTKFRFKAGEKRHGFCLVAVHRLVVVDDRVHAVVRLHALHAHCQAVLPSEEIQGQWKIRVHDEKQNRLCYPVHLSGLRQAVEAYGITPQGAHNALLFLCRKLKIFDYNGDLC